MSFISKPRLAVDYSHEDAQSRRGFLRNAALAAIAGGTLTACADSSAEAAIATAARAAAGPAPKPASTLSAGEAMDKMHEAGIKAFPAKTAGKGGQLLAPRIEKGVKIFELTAQKIQWETAPGQMVEAWAYNDQVPGPQIRVREGDRVRVILHNKLEQSTAIHFHGLELPNNVDGIPFITQPPVKPGETYTYEFTLSEGNHGSHMYHSHHNSAQQVGLGLLGAFIVEPRNPSAIERADVDYTIILNDGAHGYTLNGKSFPATEPIAVKRGQKLRIRFMNEGMMIHPMHLHGMHMTIITRDGWPVPAPFRCDTLNVAPGERWDVIVNCKTPGVWAFHCHILPHAESEHGMFGMVTAVIVS
ncbi:MAG: multicopper oxidase domain-containing protein [Gemmatimonadales bacterium]